jgi:hypothetical protein
MWLSNATSSLPGNAMIAIMVGMILTLLPIANSTQLKRKKRMKKLTKALISPRSNNPKYIHFFNLSVCVFFAFSLKSHFLR